MAYVKRPGLLQPGTYYFSGADAVAEGALAAGCRYYAGYPITPSSEIMERMSRRLDAVDGVFMQMEDELASICSVIGASWAGAKAMTATSGPGVSLMAEALGYAAGTETPLVLVNIQRAGPGTGQATHTAEGDIFQVRWGSHGDYQVIAYSPWSVQEMYDLTVKAFNMAERFRVPVFVMGSESTAHLKEPVVVGEAVEIFNRIKKPGAPPFDTEAPDGVPPMPAFGEGERLLVTGSTHEGYGFRRSDDPAVQARLVTRLYRKIMDHRNEIVETETYYGDDAEEAVIVTYGFTARSALYAVEQLRENGRKVGMVRLRTLWPFADRVIEEIGRSTRVVFVPEMNMGQAAGEIRKYAHCEVVEHHQTDGRVIPPPVLVDELERIL